MREACAEISAIDIDAAELGEINLLTAGAEDLEARGLQGITQANGENFLLVAESSGAEAVHASEILLVNLGETSW